MFPQNFSKISYTLLTMTIFLACNAITPTLEPTEEPVVQPPIEPTAEPTEELLGEPTLEPTLVPTLAPTETPALGSISGVLWHETCSFVDGSPPVLGEGCVQWGAETWEFGPNQKYDGFESGWAGVTLHLGAGACPSTGLATTVTNAAGQYSFNNLSVGTFCVSYSNLTDGNDIILIPGSPTYPQRSDAGFFQSVVVGVGEDNPGINFGYAWQFYN